MALFDNLPDKIFRPLAAANRRFYAALLMHLYERTFDTAGETPRRTDVLNEIGDFIYRHTESVFDPEAEEAQNGGTPPDAREAKDPDYRRYMAFNALSQSGWLVDLQDRYRKLVDLSPEGRLLLREFSRIIAGDTRSYGGSVLNVLGNLNGAIDNPEFHSEHIRNASLHSRDFMQHLRGLGAQMRRVEEGILRHEQLGRLFRAFFEEYVSGYLITDYKTLYTKHNPFRFRHTILERIAFLEKDALLLERLAQGYYREARADSVHAAREIILRELQDIRRAFDGIDRQLEVIDETQTRIERRIRTAIRYMDRHEGGMLERLASTLKSLGQVPASDDTAIDTPAHLLRLDSVIGGDSLAFPRQKPAVIGRTRLREMVPDPAVIAFERAKDVYARRIMLTPQRIDAFLDRVLEGRSSIRASEITLSEVDDFIVFQRLRETDLMFNGFLAKRWRITRLATYHENDWMRFPDFEIARVAPKEAG